MLVGLLAVMVVGILVLAARRWDPFPGLLGYSPLPGASPFREDLWKHPDTTPDARYAMALDLVERQVCLGQDRETVVALLGQPTGHDTDRDRYSWLLRPQEMPIDYYWLGIEFKDGRASRLYIYGD